ncbi:RNA 2',3'-cyclic phosphodiesterase [Nocardioides anomalus]|uniref:RNA 2',3'-cyclic phosphodiesterase n=1 Tax=Nocardioides anomalus TaxID=2712223 RepID=A0A6G6WIB8_9ACTN|nr:RNA 2',3'-cyclic phosphodiesterase [Nocardioides anomalus]QIG44984.1 RNA 2',3'-cyclic phosphodiesterase [Nocardioides anomalus]
MRAFVALVPPVEALEDLDTFLEVRREVGDLRWVQADQVHATLAFLGDVPDRRLDDLVERLGRAAAKRTAFPTAIAGGGAFPDAARARVVWAGLQLEEDGRTELDRLATGCRAAANRAGVPVDGTRFRPHLTVARTRAPHDVSAWVRLLDTYRGPAWVAEEMALVASYLGEGARGRPRHQVVETFALTPGT